MPIYEKSHLKCMNITVEELGNKHQLNPDNVGVRRIDDCLSYNSSSGIFRSDILGIRSNDTANIQGVSLKYKDDEIRAIISHRTELLTAENNYVSISQGTLRLGTRVLIVKNDSTHPYAVTSITGLGTGYTYSIKTSRSNYLLDCGLVVKSD